MNFTTNLPIRLKEFCELNPGDCFAWIGEDEIGPDVFMRIGDIKTNKETITNIYINLRTGEVNTVNSLFTDCLVLLVE